ncbi:purine-nucleoside phosphorylase [Balneolales bacterium ANBcel1]|nr:purine-nucleoside phosphorylase [Balneolales bacterium ANBcel1]
MSTSHQIPPETAADEIAQILRKKGIGIPDASVILGSGLGNFTQVLDDAVVVPYKQIPGFPATSVAGHDGALHFGRIGDRNVLVWSGRFHFYEGHPFERTILPVQVAHALGCRSLIVTNAAGGINDRFQVGDLMLIDDIITLMVSVSPWRNKLYKRYSNDGTVESVIRMAARAGIPVTRGCYLFAKGPTYETKAEVRAFRAMGADAVGMSTAAELYEAIRLDMQCLGISLITNKATGVSKGKLDHGEIKEAATLREKEFVALVSGIITDRDSPLYC